MLGYIWFAASPEPVCVDVDVGQGIRQIQSLRTFAEGDEPDFMTALASEIPLHGKWSVTNILTQFALQVAKLRTLSDGLVCHERSESTIRAILDLIKRCQDLNTLLATWRETIPEIWKYTSRSYDLEPDNFDCETSKVYPGNVDVYPDIWVARTWNTYRTTRIFVQAIILRCVVWVAGGDTWGQCVGFQVAVALQIIKELVDEICASVPFHLGHCTTTLLRDTVKLGDSLDTNTTNGQEDMTTKHLGGYFLLWPLCVARSTRVISQEQARWITTRLLYIAGDFGLDERLVLKELNEHPIQALFRAPPTFGAFL